MPGLGFTARVHGAGVINVRVYMPDARARVYIPGVIMARVCSPGVIRAK